MPKPVPEHLTCTRARTWIHFCVYFIRRGFPISPSNLHANLPVQGRRVQPVPQNLHGHSCTQIITLSYKKASSLLTIILEYKKAAPYLQLLWHEITPSQGTTITLHGHFLSLASSYNTRRAWSLLCSHACAWLTGTNIIFSLTVGTWKCNYLHKF